jgi:hypothetical protein
MANFIYSSFNILNKAIASPLNVAAISTLLLGLYFHLPLEPLFFFPIFGNIFLPLFCSSLIHSLHSRKKADEKKPNIPFSWKNIVAALLPFLLIYNKDISYVLSHYSLLNQALTLALPLCILMILRNTQEDASNTKFLSFILKFLIATFAFIYWAPIITHGWFATHMPTHNPIDHVCQLSFIQLLTYAASAPSFLYLIAGILLYRSVQTLSTEGKPALLKSILLKSIRDSLALTTLLSLFYHLHHHSSFFVSVGSTIFISTILFHALTGLMNSHVTEANWRAIATMSVACFLVYILHSHSFNYVTHIYGFPLTLMMLASLCAAIFFNQKPEKSTSDSIFQVLTNATAFVLINPIFCEHWFHVFMPQIHPATQLITYKFIPFVVKLAHNPVLIALAVIYLWEIQSANAPNAKAKTSTFSDNVPTPKDFPMAQAVPFTANGLTAQDPAVSPVSPRHGPESTQPSAPLHPDDLALKRAKDASLESSCPNSIGASSDESIRPSQGMGQAVNISFRA